MVRIFAGLCVGIALLVTPVASASADFNYPELPEKGSALSDWVPTGWLVKEKAKGDLNKDGREDLALILERKEPAPHRRGCGKDADTSNAPPRILILLLTRAEGGYQLSAVDTKIVSRADEGRIFGDPLEMLLVERGSVVLHHYGGSAWRWFQTYRFRYQDTGWFLIGFTDGSNHNVSRLSTMYDYNPLTGKMEITASDENGRPGCYACLPGEKCPGTKHCDKGLRQAKQEVTWIKTKKRPLVRLNETYCRYKADKILPITPRW